MQSSLSFGAYVLSDTGDRLIFLTLLLLLINGFNPGKYVQSANSTMIDQYRYSCIGLICAIAFQIVCVAAGSSTYGDSSISYAYALARSIDQPICITLFVCWIVFNIYFLLRYRFPTFFKSYCCGLSYQNVE